MSQNKYFIGLSIFNEVVTKSNFITSNVPSQQLDLNEPKAVFLVLNNDETRTIIHLIIKNDAQIYVNTCTFDKTSYHFQQFVSFFTETRFIDVNDVNNINLLTNGNKIYKIDTTIAQIPNTSKTFNIFEEVNPNNKSLGGVRGPGWIPILLSYLISIQKEYPTVGNIKEIETLASKIVQEVQSQQPIISIQDEEAFLMIDIRNAYYTYLYLVVIVNKTINIILFTFFPYKHGFKDNNQLTTFIKKQYTTTLQEIENVIGNKISFIYKLNSHPKISRYTIFKCIQNDTQIYTQEWIEILKFYLKSIIKENKLSHTGETKLSHTGETKLSHTGEFNIINEIANNSISLVTNNYTDLNNTIETEAFLIITTNYTSLTILLGIKTEDTVHYMNFMFFHNSGNEWSEEFNASQYEKNIDEFTRDIVEGEKTFYRIDNEITINNEETINIFNYFKDNKNIINDWKNNNINNWLYILNGYILLLKSSKTETGGRRRRRRTRKNKTKINRRRRRSRRGVGV
jgi:hypothetical protein